MPFFGLSVLIHVCIIGIHRIFKWSERIEVHKSRLPRHAPTIPRYIAGGIIIIGIFSFISSLGVILIQVCLIEDHSSIVFAEEVWSELQLSSQANISASPFAIHPTIQVQSTHINPWEYALRR